MARRVDRIVSGLYKFWIREYAAPVATEVIINVFWFSAGMAISQFNVGDLGGLRTGVEWAKESRWCFSGSDIFEKRCFSAYELGICKVLLPLTSG